MKVSKDDVLYTASLAKINIEEKDVEAYRDTLTKQLEYAKSLDNVDTENVKPLAHVLDLENVVREDEIKEGLNIEEALQNAPDKDGKCINVPKML